LRTSKIVSSDKCFMFFCLSGHILSHKTKFKNKLVSRHIFPRPKRQMFCLAVTSKLCLETNYGTGQDKEKIKSGPPPKTNLLCGRATQQEPVVVAGAWTRPLPTHGRERKRKKKGEGMEKSGSYKGKEWQLQTAFCYRRLHVSLNRGRRMGTGAQEENGCGMHEV
jgi:hypothetical protein